MLLALIVWLSIKFCCSGEAKVPASRVDGSILEKGPSSQNREEEVKEKLD
jgi:hypothetical protein